MKLLIFNLILLINIYLKLTTAESLCGRAADNRIDNIVSKLLTIGNTGRRFPENYDQLPKYCRTSRKYVTEIINYNKKCLDKFSKQVFSVLIFTVQSQVRQLCSRRNRRVDELLEAAPCSNKGSDGLHKCQMSLIDASLGIKIMKDDKQKLPTVCCEVFKVKSCIRESLEKVDGCDEKKIDTILRFFDTVSGGTLNVLCGENDESSDRCARPYTIPPKSKGEPKYKSFVLPTIDILRSFPEV